MPKTILLAFLKAIKILGDLTFINIGIVFAFLIRFKGVIPEENWPAYLDTAPWITVLALILFKIYGLYETKSKNLTEVFLSLFCVVLVSFVGIMVFSFLFRGFAFPRTVIFITPITQLILLSFWRYILQGLFKKLSGSDTILVVGRYLESQQLATKVARNSLDLSVIGLVVDYDIPTSEYNCEFPIVGRFDDLSQIAKDDSIDYVLLCPSFSRDEKASLTNIALANNKKVLLVPEIYDILVAQARVDQIGDTPIFHLANFKVHDNYRLLKRIMDFSFALIGLVILWPLIILISLLVVVDSKGPVFYSQERVSEGGKIFKLHKFRTMFKDAEKLSGPVLATENDPRVTRVGRFLRATRIDELPQLVNILKGEMSLVGPRPERPYFVEQFNKEYPGYVYRQKVKSGLTGLAQVAGKYSTTPEDKLRYDLLYAKTNSFLNDLKIILQTLKVILMKDKSA